MNTNYNFDSRLGNNVDPAALIERAVDAYGLSKLISCNAIELGFEDYNVKVETQEAAYVMKVFARTRHVNETERYANVINSILAASIAHPALLSLKDKHSAYVYHDGVTGLAVICMAWIDGMSFYRGDVPDDHQLALIMKEVVKIHSLNISPSYVFDSWAVPNIEQLYTQVKSQLGNHLGIATRIVENYRRIPIEDLPKCFVHGDIIKSNVLVQNTIAYIIDFAGSNIYPRIQELAVMAANLLASNEPANITMRIERVVNAYIKAGGRLEKIEYEHLYNYTAAAILMELMGSIHDSESATEEETEYWKTLAVQSLEQLN